MPPNRESTKYIFAYIRNFSLGMRFKVPFTEQHCTALYIYVCVCVRARALLNVYSAYFILDYIFYTNFANEFIVNLIYLTTF